jgi:iron complex outermembrane receptor protein
MSVAQARYLASCVCVVSTLALAAPLVAAPYAPGPAAAATEALGQVEGQVKDLSGGVIVGASVTLQSASGGSQRDTATDARGHYRFDRVPAGAYLLIAFRDGFSAATQEVLVGAAAPVTLDVTLSPASLREEVTVSFTGSHATSLKIDTPVRDIPLSIQSYTSSFVKAIEATNVADLYVYTIGVSRVAPNSAGMVIRGVRAAGSGQNLQYNGLPGPSGRFGSPPLANVERIEVLKGPASVLYGQAEPGGIVNIVTKKPQAERAQVIDLRGGTFFGGGTGFGDANEGRVVTDLTGPLDSGRKLLYRFIASYDNARSFRAFGKTSDLYVVPSVSWLGWLGTIVNLELEYRRVRGFADDGLVAPNNDITRVAPITTRYQEPDDYQNENAKAANVSLRKAFGNGFNWSAAVRSVRSDDDTKRYGNGNVRASGSTFLLLRSDGRNVNQRHYDFLDTTLSRAVHTASVQHRFLVGLNAGHELNDFDRRVFSAPAGQTALAIDLYNPVYGRILPPANPDTHRHINFRTYAAYLNDQIEFTPKLKGMAGLRVTHHETQQEELRINPGITPLKKNDAVLPLAGLVFQPDQVWSFYGSFSTSFTPPGATLVDASGRNSFDPETARQYEVGTKAALGNGRGEATLALFDIRKKNVIVGVGSGISQQFGKAQSRGVEAQVTHRILDTWQAIVGYTYVESSLVNTVAGTAGRPETQVNAPKHSANLWSRYDIPHGALHGLGVGLGLVYIGERLGTLTTATAPLVLPSYFRVDTGLYYVASRYEVTARIVNLTDKVYYEGTSGNANGVTPGSPRAASLSLRVRF